jgi:hypothetical protein
MYTTNVEHKMYDYTSNNLSLQNSNKCLKKNLEAITRNIQSIDSLQKAAILGTSLKTESTAVCPMKTERWKSP